VSGSTCGLMTSLRVSLRESWTPETSSGQEQILAYMTAYPSRIFIEGVDKLRVHPALDPNVVVVEMTIKGRAVETEKPTTSNTS